MPLRFRNGTRLHGAVSSWTHTECRPEHAAKMAWIAEAAPKGDGGDARGALTFLGQCVPNYVQPATFEKLRKRCTMQCKQLLQVPSRNSGPFCDLTQGKIRLRQVS